MLKNFTFKTKSNTTNNKSTLLASGSQSAINKIQIDNCGKYARFFVETVKNVVYLYAVKF